MEKNYIDLFELQTLVKELIDGAFPYSLWIKAEIAEIKAGKHCYLSLVQNENGAILAKVNANIWSRKWQIIERRFLEATGAELAAGQEILVNARVTYHVQYGFSLNIEDIDPDFTLGAKERQKKQTIERLEKEGLMDRQKKLELCRLPYRLAVISAPGAAGFGDFKRHLTENNEGFVFDIRLYESLMQGDRAAQNMTEAFEEILSSPDLPDAILIMRGGGSELDLACFDDYGLAVAIAKCPIPVITAIGHDKDYHVADMVANHYVKTPTALADLFLDRYLAEDQRLCDTYSKLVTAFLNRIASMDSRVSLFESRIFGKAENLVSEAGHRIDRIEDSLAHGSAKRLDSEDTRLDKLGQRAVSAAKSAVDKAESKLDADEKVIYNFAYSVIKALSSDLQLKETKISNKVLAIHDAALSHLDFAEKRIIHARKSALSSADSRIITAEAKIKAAAKSAVTCADSNITNFETRLTAADPRNILKRGYVLAMSATGAKMNSALAARPGDRVKMMFADGTVHCGVTGVELKSNIPGDESLPLPGSQSAGERKPLREIG